MARRKTTLRNYRAEWNQFVQWMPSDDLANEIIDAASSNATGDVDSHQWFEAMVDTIAMSHDERYVQRWDEFRRHYVTTDTFAFWSVTPVE